MASAPVSVWERGGGAGNAAAGTSAGTMAGVLNKLLVTVC